MDWASLCTGIYTDGVCCIGYCIGVLVRENKVNCELVEESRGGVSRNWIDWGDLWSG